MAKRNIRDFYDIGEELGRGAFSIVYTGTNKETGEKYAIKIIDRKSLGKDNQKLLAREIDILVRVSHPNIVSLKELFESDDAVCLVMELVTGGELFDKIVELGNYSEREAAIVVAQMLSAIDYLHEQQIVHRDLKPENLLVKTPDSITDIKIGDFGLSRIMGQETMMQTACGTPGYVAPEVLSATGYGKEVDLWSIGVITYILLCGFPPFYSDSVPELFEKIMNAEFDYPPEYWDDISPEAKDFINKLLVVEPSRRLTCRDAMEHPWIKGHAPESQLKSLREIKKYTMLRRKQSQVLAGELRF